MINKLVGKTSQTPHSWSGFSRGSHVSNSKFKHDFFSVTAQKQLLGSNYIPAALQFFVHCFMRLLDYKSADCGCRLPIDIFYWCLREHRQVI